MFKKIYAPIDNSDVSDKVLAEVIDLAKFTGSSLRIAHVVSLEQIAFGIEMVGVTELKETLLGIANKLIEHVKSTLKAKEVEAEVVLLENYGASLATLLVDDAKSWNADLFVLGSHHLGSFSHFITGGIAEDIAHSSDIPILLITKHKSK